MSYIVNYQGVDLTIHEREDWQPERYPILGTYRFKLDAGGKPIPGSGYLFSNVVWSRRDPTKITHQAIHYTADDQLPDGDPGETINNVRTYIQNMQLSYARHRAYSLGYSWIVDYLGGIWECRGEEMKCAAHAPANDYADAILVLRDGDEPANSLQIHSIRYLIRRAEMETGRLQYIVGHKELKGAATACPGAGLLQQIHSGVFNPIVQPIIPNPDPTTIFGGNDMAQLIRITDNGQSIDPAVLSVTGTFVEWIETQGRGDALVLIKAVEHAGPEGVPPMQPTPIDRGFLQYFTLLGRVPVYPVTYVGPKTSPADFTRWVQ